MTPVHPIQGMQGMRIPAPVIQIPEEILPIMILRERMAPIPGTKIPVAPIQGKGLIPGMEMTVPKIRAALKGTTAGRTVQRMGTAPDRKAALRMRVVPLVKTALPMRMILPMRAALMAKVVPSRKAARKSLYQTRLRNQKKIRIRKRKPVRRTNPQLRRNPQPQKNLRHLLIPRLLLNQPRQDRTHRAGQENRVSFLRQNCKSL